MIVAVLDRIINTLWTFLPLLTKSPAWMNLGITLRAELWNSSLPKSWGRTNLDPPLDLAQCDIGYILAPIVKCSCILSLIVLSGCLLSSQIHRLDCAPVCDSRCVIPPVRL